MELKKKCLCLFSVFSDNATDPSKMGADVIMEEKGLGDKVRDTQLLWH